jgi:subtilisin family serine protease
MSRGGLCRRSFLASALAATAAGGVGRAADGRRRTVVLGVSPAADTGAVLSRLERRDRGLSVQRREAGTLRVETRASRSALAVEGVRSVETTGDWLLEPVDWAIRGVRNVLADRDDATPADQWVPDRVGAREAGDRLDGDGVTVAVVDTGVDGDHPDLPAYDAARSRDFVRTDQSDASPLVDVVESHGTHVAGVVGAVHGGDGGVEGVSDATLLGVRVLGSGGGSADAVAAGIRHAARQGADVINASLGSSRRSKVIEAAVDEARSRGALVVAASGNDGNAGVAYPAAYDGVLGVGATDRDDERAPFSQHGADLDLVAPGVSVLSTIPRTWFTTGYARYSGTSMAAPVVSGVAALAAGALPEVSPAELAAWLTDTATPLDAPAWAVGAGRVDAGRLAATLSGADLQRSRTSTYEGRLDGPRDQRVHVHRVRERTRRLSVTLSTPEGAGRDYDLYLTRDGREPAVDDHDDHSWGPGTEERVVLRGPGERVGVLVRAFGGSGPYEVTVEET